MSVKGSGVAMKSWELIMTQVASYAQAVLLSFVIIICER